MGESINHLIPVLNFQNLHLVEQLHYFHLLVQGLIKIPVGLFDGHEELPLDALQLLLVPGNQLLVVGAELFLRTKYLNGLVAVLQHFDARLYDGDEYLENLVVEVALPPFGNDYFSEIFAKPHK